MSDQTAITWCDSTFNPWIGCSKISPACDNCYAERLMDHRLHRVQWGPGRSRKRTSATTWRQPLLWEREHEAFELAHGRRRRVFCASLADVFDNEIYPTWRTDLFELIDKTRNLDWLLLTKRIGNVAPMMENVSIALALRETNAPWPPRPNVWLGITVVNQAEANRDIPKLLATPAAVRFLSIEPMLGPVYVEDIPDPVGGVCLKPLAGLRWVGDGQGRCTVRSTGGRIDWVIAGGESGPHARPTHPDWVRSLRDQCAAARVPFHLKQWGEWAPGRRVGATDSHRWPIEANEPDGGVWSGRIGVRRAGRLLDGVEHNGFPAPAA